MVIFKGRKSGKGDLWGWGGKKNCARRGKFDGERVEQKEGPLLIMTTNEARNTFADREQFLREDAWTAEKPRKEIKGISEKDVRSSAGRKEG